jgi:hypothetical protein
MGANAQNDGGYKGIFYRGIGPSGSSTACRYRALPPTSLMLATFVVELSSVLSICAMERRHGVRPLVHLYRI